MNSRRWWMRFGDRGLGGRANLHDLGSGQKCALVPDSTPLNAKRLSRHDGRLRQLLFRRDAARIIKT